MALIAFAHFSRNVFTISNHYVGKGVRFSFLPCVLPFLLLTSNLWPARAESASTLESLLPDVPYTRKTDRTHVFSRAQFKFSLLSEDHLNRYVDRPLLLDPDKYEAYARFATTAECAQAYGLDGLAFFPTNGGCQEVYAYASKAKIPGLELLTEFHPSDKMEEMAALALATPASFTVNGKVVISTYATEREPIEYWQKTIAGIKERHGEKFLFIPELGNFGGIPLATWMQRYQEGSISPKQLEVAREHLRKWLRVADGIYFASTTIVRDDNRNFNTEFYRNFIIRMMKSVLAEPEFKEKLLGLSAKVGHENHTRMGRTLSSNGTQTLRDSLEAAIDAKPDFINIPEWDELNESTCLMPTIFDATSSQRIVRYYVAKLNGKPLKPIAGDQLDIPNLIVSYRKLLALGEKLEIELLNVPDGGAASTYQAILTLTDDSGKQIYVSPELTFSSEEMKDQTLTIPSESLSGARILRPHLQLTAGGQSKEIDQGLHYIEVRPTWNWDYKWVKQPIRDLLHPTVARFQLSDVKIDGTREAQVQLEVDEPLASVDILENDNIIYSHSLVNDPWRESPEQVVFSLAWKSSQIQGKPTILKGNITVQDGTAQWVLQNRTGDTGVDQSAIQGQTFSLDGQRSNIWQRRVLLAIPRADLDKAKLSINLPGKPAEIIPVSKIFNDSAYGISGPRGFNLLISRFTRERRVPSVLNTTDAAFSVPVLPELATSVFHFQAVTKSKRIFRSEPIALGNSREQTTVTVYSDSVEKPVSASAAIAAVPIIDYQFTPGHGSLLMTSAGRPLWGILGGFSTLVTERGAAPGDGAPFFVPEYPANAEKTAPDWVEIEDGKFALQFDGKGTYVTLPQGVVPRRAAYVIEMELKPDDIKGRQTVLANFSSRFGTLAIFLKDGVLKADFLHDMKNGLSQTTSDIDSGLPVEPGRWSSVKIGFDQGQLSFEVNGNRKSIALSGPGMNDTVSAIGGMKDAWFRGQIRGLRIKHGKGNLL